ncbi:MAG: DUF4105 domain-containing protein [Bacteriovoracaceae bacterium]
MCYLKIALLLFSFNLFAQDYQYSVKESARNSRLFEQSAWLRLLHYRKGIINSYKSEADGEAFFTDKNGKYNPKAELLTFIDAIFKTDQLDSNEHAICRFPLRFKWLVSTLKIDPTKLPQPSCEKYNNFIKQVKAKSASIVFSSYYLNNPASVFGHTFLRLNKNNNNELLDTGINFGAATNGANPLYYVVGGFMGAFPGAFIAIPYYYKVREYNNYESRDLWSYNLNLSEEMVGRLVDHIWEVGNTNFDYYFLDENCSYHVLNLIDAINPEFHFIDELPFKGYIYTIPIDTIYALYTKENFVASVDYRPSSSTLFYNNFEKLNQNQKTIFYQIIKEDADLSMLNSLSEEDRVKILDLALNYIDYKYAEAILKEDSEKTKWKKRYLLERSKIALSSVNSIQVHPEKELPHNGHPSRKAALGIGHDSKLGTLAQFHFKFSLHDFTDPQTGFSPYMILKMGEVNFDYYEKTSKVRMKNVTLYELLSLPPLTEARKNLSWKMSIGQKLIKDKNSENPYSSIGVEGGVGATVNLKNDFTLFGLMLLDLGATKKITNNHNLRLGGGPTLGLRWMMNDYFLTALQFYQGSYLFLDHKNYFTVTWENRLYFSKYYGLSFNLNKNSKSQEFSSQFILYF